MEETLSQLIQLDFLAEEPKTINANDAVAILNERIQAVFPNEASSPHGALQNAG
jgi:hypothetical protein